jgi:hypothetical protein
VPDRDAAGRADGPGRRRPVCGLLQSLLVNVGCHSDAHEQAKWFGDDIELKSHKYDYDQKSLVAAAASFRRLGRGHPPIHRFRIGLEFALSGFRDLDGMIAQHADIACSLAAELGLPDEVQNAISASYERAARPASRQADRRLLTATVPAQPRSASRLAWRSPWP